MEERFNRLNAQVSDLKKLNEQTTKRSRELQEQIRANEVKAHIFEACKDEKKFKNALVERLLAAGLKTKEEVDARIPVERAAIEKLLVETAGGRGSGVTGKDEPAGTQSATHKTKSGMVLTEAELRQRQLAGLETELVEQAS